VRLLRASVCAASEMRACSVTSDAKSSQAKSGPVRRSQAKSGQVRSSRLTGEGDDGLLGVGR
jgi:hypothetical protein